MDYDSAKKYLEGIGQQHLLKYYGELSDDERRQLLSDIEKTDFGIIKNLEYVHKKNGEVSPMAPVSLDETERCSAQFDGAGLKLLSEGKVAAVLLAGGQGSRLGFDKPKGMYNMGVTRFLSIFELHMNNMKSVAARAGRHFPLFIMTSANNNEETIEFFEDNDYFGYPKSRVYFFIQDVAPACSFEGKVFLDEKHRISLAPNGNGGWYTSLISSGLNKVIEDENIQWINICGVDNVLQRICDPVFIGATVFKGCSCGAKVVRKVNPDENVGLLCSVDGRPAVIEYYEMDEKLKRESVDGNLVYRNGVILNYLFKVSVLNAISLDKLPYHLAKKKIAHIENGIKIKPEEPCGYKFETLVVDMVSMMESCIPFEVAREKEFAPVKNLNGADSPETACALLMKNGIVL